MGKLSTLHLSASDLANLHRSIPVLVRYIKNVPFAKFDNIRQANGNGVQNMWDGMRFDSLTGQEVVKTYVEAPHISNILAWPAQPRRPRGVNHILAERSFSAGRGSRGGRYPFSLGRGGYSNVPHGIGGDDRASPRYFHFSETGAPLTRGRFFSERIASNNWPARTASSSVPSEQSSVVIPLQQTTTPKSSLAPLAERLDNIPVDVRGKPSPVDTGDQQGHGRRGTKDADWVKHPASGKYVLDPTKTFTPITPTAVVDPGFSLHGYAHHHELPMSQTQFFGGQGYMPQPQSEPYATSSRAKKTTYTEFECDQPSSSEHSRAMTFSDTTDESGKNFKNRLEEMVKSMGADYSFSSSSIKSRTNSEVRRVAANLEFMDSADSMAGAKSIAAYQETDAYKALPDVKTMRKERPPPILVTPNKTGKVVNLGTPAPTTARFDPTTGVPLTTPSNARFDPMTGVPLTPVGHDLAPHVPSHKKSTYFRLMANKVRIGKKLDSLTEHEDNETYYETLADLHENEHMMDALVHDRSPADAGSSTYNLPTGPPQYPRSQPAESDTGLSLASLAVGDSFPGTPARPPPRAQFTYPAQALQNPQALNHRHSENYQTADRTGEMSWASSVYHNVDGLVEDGTNQKKGGPAIYFTKRS
jgi:hypothetical protein